MIINIIDQKIKTERLYYDYCSTLPFVAEILEIRPAGNDKTQLILDKTIFYPEGGGQLCDLGTINGVQLLSVQEKDDEILHFVSNDAGSLKSGPASLVLDARRRRDHSALHTGQHILSGLTFRMTGVQTVSMHMGEETCTIDVEAAEMSNETLIGIEDAVAAIIEENRPVILHLCPPNDVSSFPLRKVPPKGEDVIRVLEIEGCDIIACCGTHLKSTAEVGMLRILGAEKYKGMTRITFIAGRRVLLDSRRLRENAGIISRALSIPLAETGQGVLELIEKLSQTEKRLKAFEEKAIGEKAEALVRKADLAVESAGADTAIVIETYTEEDMIAIQNIGKIAQKKTQATLILVSLKEVKFVAFASGKEFDIRQFLKDAFEKYGGKGGGSATFFQGSFGTKEALDGFIKGLISD